MDQFANFFAVFCERLEVIENVLLYEIEGLLIVEDQRKSQQHRSVFMCKISRFCSISNAREHTPALSSLLFCYLELLLLKNGLVTLLLLVHQ